MERAIKTVGICGLGQMGAAAAVCFGRAGYRVLLWGRDLKKLSAEVVREESEKTPMARKVHASFTKFQALLIDVSIDFTSPDSEERPKNR